MIIRIIILFSLLINFAGPNKARADIYADDTCTNTITLINRLVTNLTTAGFFSYYSAMFSMDGAPNTQTTRSGCDANYYGGSLHDPKYCYDASGFRLSRCTNDLDSKNKPILGCDPNGGLTFTYNTFDFTQFKYTDQKFDVSNGWNQFFILPPAAIQAVNIGDQLCVQFWTILGYQTIGCKYRPDCSVFSLSSPCYVAQSCASNGFQNSKSLFPMTGMIVQCIKESMLRLFVNVSACNNGFNNQQNYFPNFQNSMRRAVRAALLLYVILFGIKMALGGEMPDKGEFFKFGTKFVLVLYFSVGISIGHDSNGNPLYDDGFTKFIVPLFTNGSSELANLVYQAAGGNGLCNYTGVDYTGEDRKDYSYLAFWDSLDCRILYYLGFNLGGFTSLATGVGEGGVVSMAAVLAAIGAPTLFIMIIPAILSGQIVFAIFCILFCLFLISIMIYILNITVLAIIAMTILIYMAPIFVPMALFEPTKSYYENWLRLLISYALQPMVMAAFMAMMITVFDQTMFGDCVFENDSITIKVSNDNYKIIPIFKLCDPHATGCLEPVNQSSGLANCSDTMGYFINPIQSGRSLTNKVMAIFFPFVFLNGDVVSNLFSSMVTLCLFAYLFFKFSAMLGEFASELTGGTNLGSMAGNPMRFVEAAALAVKAAVQAKMGDKKGAKDTAENASRVARGKDKKPKEIRSGGPTGGGGTSMNIPKTGK